MAQKSKEQGARNGAGEAGEERAGYRGRHDPARFVIPASDHQGHSNRVFFRCPPAYDRMAEVVLESKRFPFKSKGDVWRWCAKQGMEMLDRLEPGCGLIGQAQLVEELCRVQMYRRDFMAMFEGLQTTVMQHLADGMAGEARKLLAMAKAEVDRIEEDEWRKRCLAEMRQRFGHLMNGDGPRVKLGSRRREGEEEEGADDTTR